MEQTWNDLLFAHWPVAPAVLRPLVPSLLALDTFEGYGWLAVTPFHMTGVRPRFVPPLPRVSRFAELNVRTYVNYGGKPGVYFFSLDAGDRLAVWAARFWYHLPYFYARMRLAEDDGWIEYHSLRATAAEFRGRYRPMGSVRMREAGTLEHWLSERYCLYAVVRNSVYRAEIHHDQWPLQDAEAEIAINNMARASRIDLPKTAPLLHFAKKLEVLIWPLKKA
jgi:uncharacterized protein